MKKKALYIKILSILKCPILTLPILTLPLYAPSKRIDCKHGLDGKVQNQTSVKSKRELSKRELEDERLLEAFASAGAAKAAAQADKARKRAEKDAIHSEQSKIDDRKRALECFYPVLQNIILAKNETEYNQANNMFIKKTNEAHNFFTIYELSRSNIHTLVNSRMCLKKCSLGF